MRSCPDTDIDPLLIPRLGQGVKIGNMDSQLYIFNEREQIIDILNVTGHKIV